MENREKIYPAKINLSAGWENFFGSAKASFFDLLPSAKTLLLAGSAALLFLILQVFLVGIFDRLGVSPKISVPISSLFYAALFAGLAIVGGLKRRTRAKTVTANFDDRPICKMLVIRKRQK